MHYPRSFFDLQIRFAEGIARRFSLSLNDALSQYTPFAVTLPAETEQAWQQVIELIMTGSSPLDAAYRWHLAHAEAEPPLQPDADSFRGLPMFGCFYYAVDNNGSIRTHFIQNDVSGVSALSHTRIAERRAELRRMFQHIHKHLPAATTVMGNSWLYNLPAYRRLFPPSYTHSFQENTDGVFHQIVLWYQCVDRFWEVRPNITSILFERLERLTDLADLRHCFPYQRLRTSAPISDFYKFYEIEA